MKISIKDQNYYNTINACKDNGTNGVEYVRTLIAKSFDNGIEHCKQLYEEKLRWIPVDEFEFKIKDLTDPETLICKKNNKYSVIDITDLFSISYVKNQFDYCRYLQHNKSKYF